MLRPMPDEPAAERPVARDVSWALALVLVAGVAAHAPTRDLPPTLDDNLQRAMLDGVFSARRGLLDLYCFVDASRGELAALRADGSMPWWADPTLRISQLRPLSSLSLALDRALDLSEAARHGHSLAIWALGVALLFVVARRLATPGVALVAAAAWALSPTQVAPVGWIANRASLLSTTLALASFDAYVRARRGGGRRDEVVSVACFSAALAAGEYALATLALFFAYELVYANQPLRARLRALALPLAPTLVYGALHVGLGYGVRASAFYLDPLASPIAFVAAAPARFAALVATSLFHVTPERIVNALTPIAALTAATASAVVLVSALRGTRAASAPTRDFARFGSAALLLSIPPLLPAFPMARLGVVPSLGSAALVACVVVTLIERRRGGHAEGAPKVPFAAAAFAALHLFAAPLVTRHDADALVGLARSIEATSLGADASAATAGREAILLDSFAFHTTVDPPYLARTRGRPVPRAWRALAATALPFTVLRASRSTLVLEAELGSLLDAGAISTLRDPTHAFAEGAVIDAGAMRVTVLEAGELGPRKLRFDWERDLDDGSFVALVPRIDGLAPIALPRVGERLRVGGLAEAGVFGRLPPP